MLLTLLHDKWKLSEDNEHYKKNYQKKKILQKITKTTIN